MIKILVLRGGAAHCPLSSRPIFDFQFADPTKFFYIMSYQYEFVCHGNRCDLGVSFTDHPAFSFKWFKDYFITLFADLYLISPETELFRYTNRL